MNSLTLLVLAAGMGSRYGGLKQIDPVGPNGETIMDYSIYDALRAGFDKVVFVIRKNFEEVFKQSIGAHFEKLIAVEYVFQELDRLPRGFVVPDKRTKPWGTTHAVLMAANQIQRPFAVINADDFYGAESFRVLAQHLRSETTDYAMVGFVLRNTLSDFGAVARGVCRVNDDQTLQAVVEVTNIERDGPGAKTLDEAGRVARLTGDEVVSMNMWGFNPGIFVQLQTYFEDFLEHSLADLKAECYLPQAVNEVVRAGHAQVKVLRTKDSWFGVTYREDQPKVVDNIRHLIESGSYPERLWV
jgi:UTP-glucose-1-phosphate uridylyltransferase